MFITIISFLAVIIVLVLAHELGHFSTAKAFGVKVNEFGIGFPPRLFSIKRGETTYSINAVPIGGFVKLAGEEDSEVERGLSSKSKGIRLIILSAGSVMNLLLPLLLFSVAFMIPHDEITGKLIVEEVAPNSPAQRAGIQVGDTILSINNRPVQNIGDLSYLQLNLGKETSLLIQHSDLTEEEVQVVPRWRPPEGEGAVGFAARLVEATVVRKSEPFWEAIPHGIRECIETLVLFKNVIISLVISGMASPLVGPVGIAQLTGEVAQAGFTPLLQFAAFLSINLGIINLLPLPALDGGRIAFVILEFFRRGKRISAATERMVHTIGFIMLISLMLLITYQDIIRIISGESLIP